MTHKLIYFIRWRIAPEDILIFQICLRPQNSLRQRQHAWGLTLGVLGVAQQSSVVLV